jgi:hypothetical protein
MTLQIPICAFDARTGLLCPICQNKFDSGQVTKADIGVSKALVELSARAKEIESVSLVKSFKTGRDYLVEVSGSSLPILRKHEIKAELEKLLDGRIWAVGAVGSNKQVIEELVYPFKIASLSTLWLPDGTKVARVIIEGAPRGATKRLAAIQTLMKESKGIEVQLGFEGTQDGRSSTGRAASFTDGLSAQQMAGRAR